MGNKHTYSLTLQWTGNTGSGTSGYHAYERSYSILAEGKPEIMGSSDPVFFGDRTKHNPEELLLASLSGCHMLWFLHLCADKGILVIDYCDSPTGTMVLAKDGSGKFSEVVLNPVVTIKGNFAAENLNELHNQANKMCFIANSVNFQVKHKGSWQIEES